MHKYLKLLLIPIAGGILLIILLIFALPKPLPDKLSQSSTTTPSTSDATKSVIATTTIDLSNDHYIEVIDSCDPYFVGTCVNMRTGPGTQYPVVNRLRTGIVLKVSSIVTENGQAWYKISQDADIRYPERVTSSWYVLADAMQLFTDPGNISVPLGTVATTTKRIIVDISKETLYAYDGNTLFMQEPISTGLEFTPTPHGTFSVYMKTPSRYMQGPLPGVSAQVYDLPGVPWDLYFSQDGAVIHGAYWHNHFGEPWSHGCVNLSPENAKKLYEWADIGTPVTVQD